MSYKLEELPALLKEYPHSDFCRVADIKRSAMWEATHDLKFLFSLFIVVTSIFYFIFIFIFIFLLLFLFFLLLLLL